MTYSELRDEFFRRIESLEISGTAELNRKCSEILGEILSENAPKISNIAQSCEKILREYYEYMNETNVRIQKELDEKNGLRIAVQKADFPEKRVAQIAKSLADPTVPPETIQRRAGSAVENVARSFYDNFVRENAKFRSKAGIKCYIVRETDGNCCKWCSALAGRYVYGDEPNDVYRRHDNCTCTVTFENGRERQDKNKWQVTETLKVPYKPLVLDKNQAETLQNSQLEKLKISEKGLTFNENSGIIESNRSLINIDSGFIPASDIESAENFAKNTLGIPNVSYKGIDIVTANEWNRELADAFSKFPELKKNINFVGTCQERNRLIREKVKAYYKTVYKKKYREKYPLLNDELLELILESNTDMEVNTFMQRFKIKDNNYAQSFCAETEIDLSEFYGISVNEIFGKNHETLINSIKDDVQNRHLPIGCDTIKCIIDHEIGHQLDNLLDLKYNSLIRSVFDEFEANPNEIKEMLSGYALKGFLEGKYDYKYSEPIAEAWSEYCNNSTPREIAEKIGKIIKRLYDEKFK